MYSRFSGPDLQNQMRDFTLGLWNRTAATTFLVSFWMSNVLNFPKLNLEWYHFNLFREEVNQRVNQVENHFTNSVANVNRQIGVLNEFRNRVEKRHREATSKRCGKGKNGGNGTPRPPDTPLLCPLRRIKNGQSKHSFEMFRLH